MKKIGLFFVALALSTAGCEKEEKVVPQYKADDIVGGLRYIKDPRTGLCFAYYWGGAYNGSPALATVPCELIPPHLLVTASNPD